MVNSAYYSNGVELDGDCQITVGKDFCGRTLGTSTGDYFHFLLPVSLY